MKKTLLTLLFVAGGLLTANAQQAKKNSSTAKSAKKVQLKENKQKTTAQQAARNKARLDAAEDKAAKK